MGTAQLLGTLLPRFGITVSLIDPADPTALEAAITPRTKWVILNSPSNPTGAAYTVLAIQEGLSLAGAKQHARERMGGATQALIEPLGITDWEWVDDYRGRPLAFAGVRLRPRDLARIGQLVLQHGQWNGRQEGACTGERFRYTGETFRHFTSGWTIGGYKDATIRISSTDGGRAGNSADLVGPATLSRA